MASPWEIIETTPEAAAALSWRRWLGPAFDAVAAICLGETKRPLDRIPCGCGCACNHRVRKRGAALVGVCDCGEECEDVPLTAADVTVWKFDLPRLGRAVAKALGCGAMVTPIGFHRTIQVTALGNPAVPVVLTVQPDAECCRNAVAHLVARLPKGFILLTPTKIGDAKTLELLTKANAGFFDMETHVELLDNGRLHAARSGAELFAAHLPERNETVRDSESLRVFRLFGELLAMGTKLKASPAQVFDLMVFKKKTKAETAVACKCVPSLITRRVALIEGHFHMPIEKLIAYASDLKERQTTVKRDRYARKKRGAIADEPQQYGEDDKPNAQEDDDGYLPEERPGYN